jgi:hypothetical protein
MMDLPYADNFEHLDDELRKVDLLIRQRVMAFRQQNLKMREISVNPTLYVSHEEIDHLLQPGVPVDVKGVPVDVKGVPADGPLQPAQVRSEIEALQREINARVAAGREAGVFLALPQLTYLFGLSPFEKGVVTICLAPELRRKYDKIFVYLQDDIARKKPSIDLVLDLLCETEKEKWRARAFFSPNAPLLRSGIIQVIDDPHNPSASSDLARFLKLDSRILNFLLGNNSIDKRLLDTGRDMAKRCSPTFSLDNVLIPPAVKKQVMNVIRGHLALSRQQGQKLVLHFYGPRGIGKRELALGICRHMNCFLLYMDVQFLLPKEAEAGTMLRLVFREVLLAQAILYLDHIDALLSGDIRSKALLNSISQMAAEYGWVTILAGENPWSPAGLFETSVFHSVRLTVPAVELRQDAWEKALEDEKVTNRDKTAWAAELARQFRLTPGQIRDAVEFAHYRYVIGDGNKQAKMSLPHLYTACRNQSNQKLTQLAVKIEPKYRWDDIILIDERIAQLKEVCSQVKYRHRVFGEWGF